MLLCLIATVQSARVVIDDVGVPILGFNIYNPDKKHIVDFTRNELQFFASSMFGISSLRDIVMVMITVTQLDIAVFSILIAQVAAGIVIRLLLAEKTYGGIVRSEPLLNLAARPDYPDDDYVHVVIE